MIKPIISMQELRTRIANRAKSSPTHRFWGLQVHIIKLRTLETAYLEAKRNRGAPGEDGVTFEAIENAGRLGFLAELADELRSGSYRPGPYRKREIPKEGGKVRTISIPAIRDRVVHGAIRLILEPIFEADFSDSSYGARPNRSAHQALREVKRGLHKRKHYVVDIDLSGFFDNIRHDRLLERIARRISDDKVMALLKLFLKSSGEKGIPQGSPLSPLLANVALNDLDHIIDRGKDFLTYVRFLDDMVVLAPDTPRGRKWGNRALIRIAAEAKVMGVDLNTEKSRVVALSGLKTSFSFLGFTFRWAQSSRTRRYYAHMAPRPKTVTSLLRKIRTVLSYSRHLTVREAVRRINKILRGWVNYFRVGNSAQAFSKVKYHVERKVRRFVARNAKRGGFGWKRWSNEVIYNHWGLFNVYRVVYLDIKTASPNQKES